LPLSGGNGWFRVNDLKLSAAKKIKPQIHRKNQ
jgi:hypothetical protein